MRAKVSKLTFHWVTTPLFALSNSAGAELWMVFGNVKNAGPKNTKLHNPPRSSASAKVLRKESV